MAFLVTALIKTTVVLTLAMLASRALRNQSAAARHLVWTCGLLAVLALPVASFAIPRWELGLVTLDLPRAPEPLRTHDGKASQDPRAAAMEVRLRDRGRKGTEAAALPPAAGASIADLSWMTLAAGAWALGAVILLGRLGIGIIAVRLVAGRTEQQDGARWMPLARELAAGLGVTNVEFRRGEQGTMPIAWGVLRPVVMMPADAETWPDDRLRVVLLHELAHVKRADCLTHILAQAACAIHWINPLAWTAVRHARIERERACDDLVLTCGTSDVHYADQLLEIARAMRASRFSAAMAGASLAMAHRSQLEGRLMAILDRSVPRTPLSRTRTAAAGALAFAVLVPLASVQPWASAVVPQMPAVKPAAEAVVDSVAHALAAGTRQAIVESIPAAVEGALEQARQRPNPNPDPNPNRGRDDDGQAKPADPKVIAALMTALKDSDKEVRETAMHALVQLRAPNMFEPLLEALKDGSPDVRENAAFGLGQLRDKRAVAPLTGALKDSAAGVREQAVFALGQLRDPAAVDALTIALRDESPNVREQAAFALGQIRGQAAVDALMAALKDASENVREQAAFALGQLGDARALDALTAALKDASADVRQQAAFAIGQLAKEQE
jgi:HEAT repeat protein/beta-lactamase regulating signal transducer with metallopeptidase domain